jgi:SAM-dependent methyltransferase
MASYLDVMYDKKLKPETIYPHKLCSYLFNRFVMQKGMTIVDVGCGRGDCLKAFQALGLTSIGLDRERLDLQLAGVETHSGIDFEHDAFPLPNASVDIVFSKSVIEHLHNPKYFMREIQRILKPGGRVIIMTPDWQSQRYIFYNDYTHVQPYITSGLANLLKLSDFKEVSAGLFYQLPFTWRISFTRLLLYPLRLLLPVKRVRRSSFWRWSRELMILGTGVK